MANMSYCRFENTLPDLQDCLDNLWDEDLSKREYKARTQLIKTCKEIAGEVNDEDWQMQEYEEREQ